MKKTYWQSLKTKLNRKITLMVKNTEFISDVKAIRESWQIPVSGIKSQQDLEEWYRKAYVGDFNSYMRQVGDLLIKYKITPLWKSGISRFVLLNDPKNMAISTGVTVKRRVDLETGFEIIQLEIDADTKLADIEAVWHLVENLQNMMPYKKQSKYQPVRNIDRDNRILELYSQGDTSYAKIADTIEKEYGDSLSDTYLSSLLKRHKKRLSIKS